MPHILSSSPFSIGVVSKTRSRRPRREHCLSLARLAKPATDSRRDAAPPSSEPSRPERAQSRWAPGSSFHPQLTFREPCPGHFACVTLVEPLDLTEAQLLICKMRTVRGGLKCRREGKISRFLQNAQPAVRLCSPSRQTATCGRAGPPAVPGVCIGQDLMASMVTTHSPANCSTGRPLPALSSSQKPLTPVPPSSRRCPKSPGRWGKGGGEGDRGNRARAPENSPPDGGQPPERECAPG